MSVAFRSAKVSLRSRQREAIVRQSLTQNVGPEEHASRFHAGKACRQRDSDQNENPRQEVRDPSGKTRLYRLHGTRDLQFELLIQRHPGNVCTSQVPNSAFSLDYSTGRHGTVKLHCQIPAPRYLTLTRCTKKTITSTASESDHDN